MRTIYHSWLLDELAARFGEGAIDKVVSNCGSERIYIPKKPEGRLVELLGFDVLAWLVRERKQSYVYIPSKNAVAQRRRITVIENDVRLGVQTTAELARKHSVSRSHIEKVRRRLRNYDPHKRTRK